MSQLVQKRGPVSCLFLGQNAEHRGKFFIKCRRLRTSRSGTVAICFLIRVSCIALNCRWSSPRRSFIVRHSWSLRVSFMWPPYSRKRLSSHRLGHIPGPMLAALTMHHAAYCDIIKDGGYGWSTSRSCTKDMVCIVFVTYVRNHPYSSVILKNSSGSQSRPK